VALRIASASLAAVDPAPRLLERVRLRGNSLSVDDVKMDLSRFDRVLVLGAGKATYAMASAVESILGSRITDGFVAVKTGQVSALSRRYGGLKTIRAMECGHPLPNDASFRAGSEILRMTRRLSERDLVLCLMSGGISSLCVSPVNGVPPSAMRDLFNLLVHSGADTTEMMVVRGHLSKLTSGRLGRRMVPATVVGLCVSDERDDGMPWCATWTTSDGSSPRDAEEILRRYELTPLVPQSIHKTLSALASQPGASASVQPKTFNTMLVMTRDLWPAAARTGRQLGVTPHLLTATLSGESGHVGRVIASIASEAAASGNPVPAPCALIALGETTVTISRHRRGIGGPNQELAVGAAIALSERDQRHNIALCALDTDGTDGPTGLAGAVIDATSAHRAKLLGLDLPRALREHNTTGVLERLGDAVTTGHTGTNTNDLVVTVVLPTY
jgi:glycerate 2-kinase